MELEKDAKNTEPDDRLVVRAARVPLRFIKGRIVRNAAYGGRPSGIFGWPWIDVEPTGRKPKFQAALRASIRAEGIRNPLVGYGTPEGTFISFGSSRLRAARDLDLPTIPMIVNDYAQLYNGWPEVTESNWEDFFIDVPAWREFSPIGFDYHYALERNRRHEYDKAGLAWAPQNEDFTETEFSWIYEDT